MSSAKKVGSLFAGIGGIDLAFLQAGFKIVWANEFDSDTCKTYRYNFPDNNLIEDDIKNISPDQLADIDILTAGFPCQSFSVCGRQLGFNDKRGNLFFDIMRIADMKEPSVIFLENVANLVKHDNGKTFNIIHNELVGRNYYIRYIVTDACYYGVPQHRTRTYIIAFKDPNMCNNYLFPAPSENTTRILDTIDITEKHDDSEYVDCTVSKYKRLSSIMTDKEQIYRFSDYGIQSGNNGISFTLKANMGTWYDRIPFIKDNYGIRTVTPKECLALQGFPKNFDFPDIPKKSAYKQCGNTVCVPVVKLLATEILKVMNL